MKDFIVVFCVMYTAIMVTIIYLEPYIKGEDIGGMGGMEVEQSAQGEETTDTWPIFIEALIQVEGDGNDFAVGSHNDAGCLQLTPVYLVAANEILGQKGYYKLEDRFDREKSIEIFNVVNAYHNPDRDFDKALRLHNPRAGSGYRDKVINKYQELLQNGKNN